ncbi:hypothetical protein Q1695_000868 [Nippostrongylus brasiliensis]|nr:hypothetical protein Q1695_000868 [Nippostrongylus brasiliensis]
MKLLKVVIAVFWIRSINGSSLLSKTINADGSREFRIAKQIKHHTCLCQCRCVPEKSDLFGQQPIVAAGSQESIEVDDNAVKVEQNLKTSMMQELGAATTRHFSATTTGSTIATNVSTSSGEKTISSTLASTTPIQLRLSVNSRPTSSTSETLNDVKPDTFAQSYDKEKKGEFEMSLGLSPPVISTTTYSLGVQPSSTLSSLTSKAHASTPLVALDSIDLAPMVYKEDRLQPSKDTSLSLHSSGDPHSTVGSVTTEEPATTWRSTLQSVTRMTVLASSSANPDVMTLNTTPVQVLEKDLSDEVTKMSPTTISLSADGEDASASIGGRTESGHLSKPHHITAFTDVTESSLTRDSIISVKTKDESDVIDVSTDVSTHTIVTVTNITVATDSISEVMKDSPAVETPQSTLPFTPFLQNETVTSSLEEQKLAEGAKFDAPKKATEKATAGALSPSTKGTTTATTEGEATSLESLETSSFSTNLTATVSIPGAVFSLRETTGRDRSSPASSFTSLARPTMTIAAVETATTATGMPETMLGEPTMTTSGSLKTAASGKTTELRAVSSTTAATTSSSKLIISEATNAATSILSIPSEISTHTIPLFRTKPHSHTQAVSVTDSTTVDAEFSAINASFATTAHSDSSPGGGQEGKSAFGEFPTQTAVAAGSNTTDESVEAFSSVSTTSFPRKQIHSKGFHTIGHDPHQTSESATSMNSVSTLHQNNISTTSPASSSRQLSPSDTASKPESAVKDYNGTEGSSAAEGLLSTHMFHVSDPIEAPQTRTETTAGDKTTVSNASTSSLIEKIEFIQSQRDLPERWKGLIIRLKKKLEALKAQRELLKALSGTTSPSADDFALGVGKKGSDVSFAGQKPNAVFVPPMRSPTDITVSSVSALAEERLDKMSRRGESAEVEPNNDVETTTAARGRTPIHKKEHQQQTTQRGKELQTSTTLETENSDVVTTTVPGTELYTTPSDVTITTPAFLHRSLPTLTMVVMKSEDLTVTPREENTEQTAAVPERTITAEEFKAVGGFVIQDGSASSSEEPDETQKGDVAIVLSHSSSSTSLPFTISDLLRKAHVLSTHETNVTGAQRASMANSHSSGISATPMQESNDFEKRIREERIRYEQAKHLREQQQQHELQREAEPNEDLREELWGRAEEMQKRMNEIKASELTRQRLVEERQRLQEEGLRKIAEENEAKKFAEFTSTAGTKTVEATTSRIRYRLRPSQCAAINKFTRVFHITDPSEWIVKNCQLAKRLV